VTETTYRTSKALVYPFSPRLRGANNAPAVGRRARELGDNRVSPWQTVARNPVSAMKK